MSLYSDVLKQLRRASKADRLCTLRGYDGAGLERIIAALEAEQGGGGGCGGGSESAGAAPPLALRGPSYPRRRRPSTASGSDISGIRVLNLKAAADSDAEAAPDDSNSLATRIPSRGCEDSNHDETVRAIVIAALEPTMQSHHRSFATMPPYSDMHRSGRPSPSSWASMR
jgi:hypothetical protein